jgi:hypothetical protein
MVERGLHEAWVATSFALGVAVLFSREVAEARKVLA